MVNKRSQERFHIHNPWACAAPQRQSDMNKENQWGPFAPDLDPGERLVRIRSLRAIVRLLTGSRGADLAELLRAAETDPAALVQAADSLDALAPLDMRKVLASYAGLGRPLPPARRDVQGYPRPVVWVTPRPRVPTVADAKSPAGRRAGRG